MPYLVLQDELVKANQLIQELEERLERRDNKIKQLKDDKEELGETNKELSNALKRSTSKSSAKASSSAAAKKNKSLAVSVSRFVQRGFWRFCKFIVNDKQLITATQKVWEIMQPAGYEGAPSKSPAIVAALSEFVELYSHEVREAVNKQRSYTQSEARKSGFEWMDDHPGKALPNAEVMLAYAKRKVCY